MKKFLYIVLTVFVFFSCESEDLASKIDESNDLYVFRGIEYLLEESDSLIYTELLNEPLIIENNDSVSQLFPVTKAIVENDTVVFCFRPDHYLPYILRPNESLTISIPESIVDNEIVLSSPIWKYSEDEIVYIDRPENASKQEIEIPPYSKMISNDLKEEFTVTYVATFVGMVTGNEVKLKGKWKRECIRYGKYKIEFVDVAAR